MGANFSSYKKKSIISALVKSFVIGASCALFATGAFLLTIKLCALKINWLLYLAVGLGVFAVGAVLTFLIIRPNDKKIAKHLDEEYSLGERAQTMIEFAKEDGDMYALQRKDAAEKISNLPRRGLSFKKIWRYLLVGALCAATFATAIVVPSRYVPPKNDDGYELSTWDAEALKSLIEDVKGLSLEDRLKISAVAELELLLDGLEDETSASSMRKKVESAAENIDNLVIAYNSYRAVALALNTDSAMDSFKVSLLSAVDSYIDENQRVNTADILKARAQQSESKIRTKLGSFVESFDSTLDEAVMKSEIREIVSDFLTPFNEVMQSEIFDGLEEDEITAKVESDGLYKALSDLSTGLGNVVENYNYLTADTMKENASAAFSAYVANSSAVLVKQVYARMSDEFICNRLSEIFKVTVSPEELYLPGYSDGSDSSGGNNNNGGGDGDKDVILGSDETIYYPGDAERDPGHVKYGDVWDKYYAELDKKLRDSNIDEETKNYIREYINSLYGNVTDDTTEGEEEQE